MPMSAEPTLKPMAVCESCWLTDHTKWEPESMDETGNILLKLVGVEVPQKVNTGEVDVCCMCGAITVCGIYEFKDPEKVYFTNDMDEGFELEMTQQDLDIFDGPSDEE